MAKNTIYLVEAIEGLLVPHPSSVGSGTIHMIGHSKFFDDKEMRHPFGLPVASQRFKFEPGAKIERVLETADGYLQAKFMDGDLYYLGTLESFESPEGSETRNDSLYRVSERYRDKRKPIPPAPSKALPENLGSSIKARPAPQSDPSS